MEWEQYPDSHWWKPLARLDIAIIMTQIGKMDEVKTLIRQEHAWALDRRRPYAGFVREVAQRIGIDVSDLPSA